MNENSYLSDEMSRAAASTPSSLTFLNSSSTSGGGSVSIMEVVLLSKNDTQESVLNTTLIYTFFVPLIILTIVGNGVILITIKFQARLLSSTSNYFILSLSTADFLVGLIIMPIMLLFTVNKQKWSYSQTVCDSWMSLDFLCSGASFLTLSAMSVERYKMLTTSYLHIRHSSKLRIVSFIGLAWLLPFVTWIPVIISSRVFSEPSVGKCEIPANKYLILGLCIFLYHIPLICMVTFYTRLIVHIRKSSMMSDLPSTAGGGIPSTVAILSNNHVNNISSTSAAAAAAAVIEIVNHEQMLKSLENVSVQNRLKHVKRHHSLLNRRVDGSFRWPMRKQSKLVKSNSVNFYIATSTNVNNNNQTDFVNSEVLANVHRINKRSSPRKQSVSGSSFKPRFYSILSCLGKDNLNYSRRDSRELAAYNSALYLQSLYKVNHIKSAGVKKNPENVRRFSISQEGAVKTYLNSPENLASNQKRSSSSTSNNRHDIDLDYMSEANENSILINQNNSSTRTCDNSKINYLPNTELVCHDGQHYSTMVSSVNKKKDSLIDSTDYRTLRIKRNRKAARMLGLLVAMFSVCWLPFVIGYPLNYFEPELFSTEVNLIIWWLGYLNSTINPFLYVYSNKNIRRSVRILFMERLPNCFPIGKKNMNKRFRTDSLLRNRQQHLNGGVDKKFAAAAVVNNTPNTTNKTIYRVNSYKKSGPRHFKNVKF